MPEILDYENGNTEIGKVTYKQQTEGGYEFTPIGRSRSRDYDFIEKDYPRKYYSL